MNMKGKEKEELSESLQKLQIEQSGTSFKRKPVIIIVIGMAGNVFCLSYWKVTLCSTILAFALCSSM